MLGESLSGGRAAAHDAARYSSIVAEPIILKAGEPPWGVVVATSDRKGHFNPDDRVGVRSVEGIRCLAEMTSLAVKIYQSRDSAKSLPTRI